MKTLIAVTGVAALLTGCQNSGDPKICASIMDPATPNSIAEAEANRSNAVWSRQRAEACVHRNAYRLAGSTDNADTVARAILEACSGAVDQTVSLTRQENFDFNADLGVSDRIDEANVVEERARKSWLSLAVLRVVEGRAGKCKPD